MPAPKKVPARFIGHSSVKLSAAGGPFVDAEGVRLEQLLLHPGDTLMIPPHEAYGETYYWPQGPGAQPFSLGLGRVALPEHVGVPTDPESGEPLLRTSAGEPRGYTASELAAKGYEFIAPRRDFAPLLSLPDYLASLPPDAPSVAEEPTIADLRAWLAPGGGAPPAAPSAASAPSAKPAPAPPARSANPAAPAAPDAPTPPPADA